MFSCIVRQNAADEKWTVGLHLLEQTICLEGRADSEDETKSYCMKSDSDLKADYASIISRESMDEVYV